MIQQVYLLWFRCRDGVFLFGVYPTDTEAEAARLRYLSRGTADVKAGYFQPIEKVGLGVDLCPDWMEKETCVPAPK